MKNKTNCGLLFPCWPSCGQTLARHVLPTLVLSYLTNLLIYNSWMVVNTMLVASGAAASLCRFLCLPFTHLPAHSSLFLI